MSTTKASTRKLSGKTRKWFLTTHIVTAAAWFGIDIALGISVVTALTTDDRTTAGIAVRALEIFAVWPMFVTGLLCLVTGVVLGIGSKYGLVRYWWVAVKLVFNVAMCLLIAFSLRVGVGEAASIGERLMAGDPTASVPGNLLGPVIVAPSMLLTAYLLSVFKPWGKIRGGRRDRGGRRGRGTREETRETRELVGA